MPADNISAVIDIHSRRCQGSGWCNVCIGPSGHLVGPRHKVSLIVTAHDHPKVVDAACTSAVGTRIVNCRKDAAGVKKPALTRHKADGVILRCPYDISGVVEA